MLNLTAELITRKPGMSSIMPVSTLFIIKVIQYDDPWDELKTLQSPA